jgi:hypothetical protein
MSFGGPAPPVIPPSGPFEASVASLASSPYSIALAIFLLNIGGRFLPFEITKEQEKFLNQPIFRRIIIFVIFFVATRNIITAGWMAILAILFIGYLFNENSVMFLFGDGSKFATASASTESKNNNEKDTKPLAQTLTPEEQQILKSLSDKAEKLKSPSSELKVEGNRSYEISKQYQRVLQNLWIN